MKVQPSIPRRRGASLHPSVPPCIVLSDDALITTLFTQVGCGERSEGSFFSGLVMGASHLLDCCMHLRRFRTPPPKFPQRSVFFCRCGREGGRNLPGGAPLSLQGIRVPGSQTDIHFDMGLSRAIDHDHHLTPTCLPNN